MRLTQIIVSALCLGLPACATVDFAEMAPQREAAVVVPAQKNVAIRAAETLTTSFTENGWSAEAEPNRMHKAANMLLRGIGKPERVIDNSYAGKAKSIIKVRQDILLASADVEQALKAVEVYLAMADQDADLQAELTALEKTVEACHKGELMLMRALEEVGAKDVAAEIYPLKVSTDKLKAVTNIYGDKVRAKAPIVGGAAS